MEVTLIFDARAELAEAPFWDATSGTLYWVDIMRGELHLFDPVTLTDRRITLGQMVGTVVPRVESGVALAMEDGFARLELESETLSEIALPERGNDDVRFNDGKCDPAGRFWAGTISHSRTPGAAALYRLDPDGRAHRVLDGLTNSNGIAWSLDGRTMYHIDSPTLEVTAFDFDVASGEIAGRRTVIETNPDDGKPDGMTIDAEGMLWIAQFRGGCVQRWDPTNGTVLARIDLPVSNVTACAFGGPGLDELYITTARAGLSEEQLASQPTAGGIFRTRPGLRGVALPKCAI